MPLPGAAKNGPLAHERRCCRAGDCMARSRPPGDAAAQPGASAPGAIANMPSAARSPRARGPLGRRYGAPWQGEAKTSQMSPLRECRRQPITMLPSPARGGATVYQVKRFWAGGEGTVHGHASHFFAQGWPVGLERQASMSAATKPATVSTGRRVRCHPTVVGNQRRRYKPRFVIRARADGESYGEQNCARATSPWGTSRAKRTGLILPPDGGPGARRPRWHGDGDRLHTLRGDLRRHRPA